MVSTSTNEGLIISIPFDRRELILVERDVARDDDLPGFWIIALEAFVSFFESKVEAWTGVPEVVPTMLLLDMDEGATAEDAK